MCNFCPRTYGKHVIPSETHTQHYENQMKILLYPGCSFTLVYAVPYGPWPWALEMGSSLIVEARSQILGTYSTSQLRSDTSRTLIGNQDMMRDHHGSGKQELLQEHQTTGACGCTSSKSCSYVRDPDRGALQGRMGRSIYI